MKSEYDILLTFIQGDEEERNVTFELIYKKGSPYPFRSSLLKYLDKKVGLYKYGIECQELLDDTFMAVFERPDKALKALEQGVDLGKWLMSILKNKINNRYRNIKKKEDIINEDEDIPAPKEESDECLIWAMKLLKQKYPLCEKVIRLNFYFGYNRIEIAEMLNVTKGHLYNIMQDKCYKSLLNFYLHCIKNH
ncbi:RNA polymerase sigma factor [Siphonobacter sp. SORGH_AS_1065]|uniref:RNA polymerase sigma factor n=1 Tax=Siphonobacter sp. SORGH_AS_1065 TaxID=3041795 RepID=UPI002780DAFF|nr:sigma-70 family RNA polymerase sigma factor [Siphonobacter sp. SORGH_AS_1065]MDQ1089776.1 RNA polymerase sigma factor (sigma-70 family) [Siphonobacter sp. SORGH_AS_1065]